MKKSIDLEAIRSADARLVQLLEDHPELRETNNERQQALEEWLLSLEEDVTGETLLGGPRSHNRITA
jgi:hypothetical protein